MPQSTARPQIDTFHIPQVSSAKLEKGKQFHSDLLQATVSYQSASVECGLRTKPCSCYALWELFRFSWHLFIFKNYVI